MADFHSIIDSMYSMQTKKNKIKYFLLHNYDNLLIWVQKSVEGWKNVRAKLRWDSVLCFCVFSFTSLSQSIVVWCITLMFFVERFGCTRDMILRKTLLIEIICLNVWCGDENFFGITIESSDNEPVVAKSNWSKLPGYSTFTSQALKCLQNFNETY